MTKDKFLSELRAALCGLPSEDIEEWISFYSEMIDDRVEEGKAVEDAIAEIGDVQKIREEILSQTPFKKLIREKLRPIRMPKAWVIVLLVLGAPIWLSLLVAAVSVLFSLFAALASIVISLWAVDVSLLGAGVGGFFATFIFLFQGKAAAGLAILGAALISVGISIFLFFGCRVLTKLFIAMLRGIALAIKKSFIKKEVDQ